jgi:hypothetical protein
MYATPLHRERKENSMTLRKKSLLLLLTLGTACLLCFGQGSKAKWVKFDGTAEQTGETFHLRASDGGELDAPKDAVSMKGNVVKLRVGATVKVTKQPEKTATANKPANTAGCRQTQCVGLVLICCDDGHIMSACIGAWGCS